jgi:Zn-dependent M28 family amino/carboxypeptidase
MVNLLASWFPERTDRVLLVAHYDTRPRPDMESDPARRALPFLGANDGASGVALLMEIAHHLKEDATPWGIDILLVDGEELVYDENGRRFGEFFLGAKEFAKQYTKARRSPRAKSKYVCGILLDMVAGRDQVIRREPNSLRFAGRLVRELWDVAQHVGARSFVEQIGREVLDDHLALSDAGIPTADIIDFEYPHWHLATDTPENCAPESLEEVGRVVTAWLSLPKAEAKRGASR